jgi:superfamily II DNA helicase RecQ
LLNEYFRNLYPELLRQYEKAEVSLRNEIMSVSEQFHLQLQQLISKTVNPEEDAFLQERIRKAASYFLEKISLILDELADGTMVETDNSEARKKIKDAMSLFQMQIRQKQRTLRAGMNGFSTPSYLEAKSKASIEEDTPKQKKKSKAAKESSSGISISKDSFHPSTHEKRTTLDKPAKRLVSKDILHPELYDRLRSWRSKLAQEKKVPAYVILSQMALIGITNLLPVDSAQLIRISGFGKVTLERYGKEILQIAHECIQKYGYEIK